MEFDKEFRLPFRQNCVLTNIDQPINLIDFGIWGLPINNDGSGFCKPQLSLLGQTATDNNCPVMPDVYSQLVNYEYCKIHAVELDVRVTDYQELSTGTGIARNAPHFTRDPNSQLLCRLITNATDYSALVPSPAPDYNNRMRVQPNTKRGTSFHWRLPTGMKMFRGIAGRRLLTFAGRAATPGLTITESRFGGATVGGAGGSTSVTHDFNITNGPCGTAAVTVGANQLNMNARANIFYFGLGQVHNAISGMDDVYHITSKYGCETPNFASYNTIAPFATVIADNSFPRCIALTPLVNDGASPAADRKWSLQVITTLVVKARGYVPNASTSSFILENEMSRKRPYECDPDCIHECDDDCTLHGPNCKAPCLD